MISLIISILIFLLVPFLALLNYNKLLIFIALFSATSEILIIPVGGFRFSIISLISLTFFTLGKTRLKSIFLSLKYFWIEYLIFSIIGILYVIFLPWDDPYSSERAWTQAQSGRTLTGIIRFTELFLIMHFFYFIFFKAKITIYTIFNYLSIIICFQIIIGICDIYLNGAIKEILWPLDLRIIKDRFTGLNVEPRTFGRIISIYLIGIIILTRTSIDSIKFRKILILIAIIGLLLTMSASAIITLIICITYLLIFYYKLKPLHLAVCLVIALSCLKIVSENEIYRHHFENRLKQTLVENALNVIPGVPLWISGLEVFDASATAFLYKNPNHLLFGTGPNTVSIPASQYLSEYNKAIYGHNIDSVPHMGIINIIARSGIVGLIIVFIGLYQIFKNTNSKDPKLAHLFICIIIFNFMVLNIFYYIFIGTFSFISKKKYNA